MKSTIHWVSAAHAIDAEVRLYETLFTKENPNDVEEGQEFTESESQLARSRDRLQTGAEPCGCAPGDRYQFERLGYFCVDPDSRPASLVFNRTVALRIPGRKSKNEIKVANEHPRNRRSARRRRLRASSRTAHIAAAVEEAKLTRGSSGRGAIARCVHRRMPSTSPASTPRRCGLRRARPPVRRRARVDVHLALRDLFPESARSWWWSITRRTPPSAYFASPFEDATVADAGSRGRFSLRRPLARRRRISSNSKKNGIIPIRSASCIGRVTELLGFRPGADEHKVQWLSASGDEPLSPLFREILSIRRALDPSFFDASGSTADSARSFSSGWASTDGRTARRRSRRLAAGLQRRRRGIRR